MKEIWLPVDGYADQYEVSNLGRIRSLERQVRVGIGAAYTRTIPGKIIAPNNNGNGYFCVKFSSNNQTKTEYIHRIVAKTFLGNIDGKEVNHIDFDRTNNRADNLEIVTRQENIAHSHINLRHRYGENHQNSIYTEDVVKKIRKMRNDGMKPSQIMRSLNIENFGSISDIYYGRTWKNISPELL